MSVGTIIRQSAGAVAILLLWPLLLESLFTLIPTVGEKVGPWLPFAASQQVGLADQQRRRSVPEQRIPARPRSRGCWCSPRWGLVLWLIALVLLQRRDA